MNLDELTFDEFVAYWRGSLVLAIGMGDFKDELYLALANAHNRGYEEASVKVTKEFKAKMRDKARKQKCT